MIQVLVADDHPLVRAGMRHLLSDCADIEFADEAGDGNELIRMVRNGIYDVILLDLNMPGKSGIELIKQLKHEYPKIVILVLSTHKEDIYAVRTIKAGASGYICKDYAAESLVEAIRKVASGGCYISPAVAELMAREIHDSRQEAEPHSLLSDREYQVFLLTAAGKGVTEIADELNLSVKTISTHKARIKSKLKLTRTADMLRYAIKHGLVPDANE